MSESGAKQFARLLVRLRGQMTRKTLAMCLGVSPSYLQNVELGLKHPLRPDFIARCGEILNLSPDDVAALQSAAVHDRLLAGCKARRPRGGRAKRRQQVAAVVYSKLRGGAWGVRAIVPIAAGDAVRVTLKSGDTRTVIVDEVLVSGDGVWIATVRERAA